MRRGTGGSREDYLYTAYIGCPEFYMDEINQKLQGTR